MGFEDKKRMNFRNFVKVFVVQNRYMSKLYFCTMTVIVNNKKATGV